MVLQISYRRVFPVLWAGFLGAACLLSGGSVPVMAAPQGGGGAATRMDDPNFVDPRQVRMEQALASPQRRAMEEALRREAARAMSSGGAGGGAGASASAITLQNEGLSQGFQAPFVPNFQNHPIQARRYGGQQDLAFLGAGEAPENWQNSLSMSALPGQRPASFGPSYNRSLLAYYSAHCQGTPVLAELGTYNYGSSPANLLVIGCGLQDGAPPMGEASLLLQVAGTSDLFVVRWTKRVPGGFTNPAGPFSQKEISGFVTAMRSARVVPKAAEGGIPPVVDDVSVNDPPRENGAGTGAQVVPSGSNGTSGAGIRPYIPGVGVVAPSGGIRPLVPSYTRPPAASPPPDSQP